MAENGFFKDLLNAVKSGYSEVAKKHESSNAVQFIKSSISKVDAIVKTLDKMLKKRNIDVGAYAGKAKNKAQEAWEKAKSLQGEAKEKGFLNTVKAKGVELQSKLSGMFKAQNETGTSPPEEGKEEKKEPSRTEKEKAETEGNNAKAEEKTEKKQSMFSKMFSKSTERAEKRKKEIEEEKKAVQEAGKKKGKGGGWIGKILGAIGSMAGLLGKGIGFLAPKLLKGFGKIFGWGAGFIVKGLGKFITGIVPGLSASIAKITSRLAGGAVKGAASLAWGGIKAAGRMALPFLGGAAQVAGRAALMVATGPVGWIAAAATAAYAGYKLYKYLTRNNVADDLSGKLTKLRLLMYGFNDVKKDHYSKVFDLEMMMKEYTKYRDYKVVVDKMTNDDIDKILDIFKVSKSEPDKYKVLNTWFVKRFMPAYKAYMQALWSVNNNIFLDDIEKLKPLDVYNFVTRISVPTVIYDTQEVPTYDDTKVYATKTEVDQMLTNITNQCKDEANQKDPEQAKKIAEENKRKLQEQANKKAPETKAPETKPAPPPPKQPPIEQQSGEADSPTDPKGGAATDKMQTKAVGKLNQATGEIVPGSTSLEGIGLNGKLTKEKIYNLDPNVRDLFTGMAKEYHNLTGKTIPVNEAFRSYEDQAALYAKMPGKAAKPGNSTHEFGLALDINSEAANELDKLGLMRKYGFTRPIGGETWHVEPAGVALNPSLAKNDPNYRLKAIQASPGKGGDGYGAQKDSVLKKRDTAYQLAIYNEAGGVQIDPAKALKNVNANMSPTAAAVAPKTDTNKPETKSEQPKITGATSPSAGAANKDTKAAMGVDTEGEKKPPAGEGKPLDKSTPVNPTNGNTDVGKFASLSPQEAIKQAAKQTGMNEQTMLAYAQMESSLKGGSIKNKNSSATGLFQIVGGTWKALLAKYGPKYGIPADATPDNNYYNALMAMEYAKENLAGLKDYQSAGIDEATAIYLAHHYGLTGARKIISFLKQNPNTPMKGAVSEDAYAANKAAIGDNTVASYVQKISNKIDAAGGGSNAGGSETALASNTTPSGGSTSGSTPSTTTYSDPTKSSVYALNSSSQANNPVLADKDNGFQKAAYTPEQSPYKTINTAAPTAAPAPQPEPQKSSVMNPKNMEGYMQDQVNLLTQIANILTSIDGKFDPEKLKQMAGGNKSPAPPAVDKSVPKSAVDLSRKSIQA